jgi:predicted Zn-dependent protease
MSSEKASESDTVFGNLEQAVGKIRLPYADGLYDSQINLSIRKNKDREVITANSVKGISLRALTRNGWTYSNTTNTGLSHINRLAQRLNRENKPERAAPLSLPDPIQMDKKASVKQGTEQIPLEDKVQRVREIFKLPTLW